MDFIGFHWISMGFIRNPLKSKDIQWIRLDFIGFRWISMDFIGNHLISNDIEWMSPDFNGFQWVFITNPMKFGDIRRIS